MRTPLDQERRLVRYLLGEMPEAERAEVEKRLLTEDGFEEELQAALDDLLLAYVKNALPAEERRLVEAYVLSRPYARRRLAFIRDMLAAAEQVSAKEAVTGDAAGPRPPAAAWRYWAQAAVVVLALAGGILVWRARSKHPPLTVTSLPSAPPESLPAPRPSVEESATPAPQGADVIRLPSAPAAVVEAPAPASSQPVHVVVPIPESRPSFDAVVRTADGRERWRAEGLLRSKSEKAVTLTIPAGVLVAASYTLTVESEPLRDPDAPPRLKLTYRIRLR